MAEAGGRFRWSLADGLVLVLGLSVVLASFRPGLAGWPSGSMPDIIERVVGLATMALLAWTIVLLVPAMIAAGRPLSGTPAIRARSSAAMLALLAAMAFLGGEQLRAWDEGERAQRASSAGLVWVSDASLMGRDNLAPIAGLLLLSGLVLALRPGRALTVSRPSRPVADRIRLALAAAVGALFLAGFMAIPYLVLIAIEGVRNAQKPRWEVPRIGLADRIDAAGLAGFVGLVLCLLVADWLSGDLRGRKANRWGLAWRGLTLAGMLGWLTWVVEVGVNRLHPWLGRGLSLTVTPRVVVLIATALGGLAAGIVARSVAGDEGRVDRPARRWPALVGVSVVVACFLAWASASILREFRPDLGSVDLLTRGAGPIPSPSLFAQAVVALSESFSIFQQPAPLLLVIPLWLWLAWSLPKRFGDAWQPRSPLAVVAADAGKSRRFLAYWLALLALMMTAIPAFGLSALALMHRRINDVGSLGDAAFWFGLW